MIRNIRGNGLKVELAIAGIILAALIGYLIGAMIEHPPGDGGFQVLGALLGALVAITVLTLGEALKDKEKS
jgi:hypothetical protein